MIDHQPLVSVVVATHDRPQRLLRLLDALRAQSLGTERFEVIIIDDGSAAETRAALAEQLAGGRLEVRVERNHRALGPGAARNRGWRLARAPLVAFTDDDCAPCANWLAAGVAAARPGTITQGPTLPDPTELAADGVFSRTVRVESLGPRYETCNIFYPRDLLERVGGFDERFGLAPGGEDCDLAWRAFELGARAEFAPEAVVFHAVERLGAIGKLRSAPRWSETVRVFRRHPGARCMLDRGLFWNGWHFALLRSLAAFALPRQLRVVRIAVLARHAQVLHRRARREGAGPWAIPYFVLFDALEVYGVLRGALRSGTLVL